MYRPISPKSKRGLMLRIGELERMLKATESRAANAFQEQHITARRCATAEAQLEEHMGDLSRLKCWQMTLEHNYSQDALELRVAIQLNWGMMYCPIDSFCRAIADQLTHRLRHSPEFNQAAARMVAASPGYAL